MLNSSIEHTQDQLDHWANIHNPTSDEYQADLDNYANQLNPNNEAYWSSRGEEYQNPDRL